MEDGMLQMARDVFEMFDKDRSGSIDESELGIMFRELGQECSSAKILKILAKMDKDGNGLIDFEEFIEMLKVLEITEVEDVDDISLDS